MLTILSSIGFGYRPHELLKYIAYNASYVVGPEDHVEARRVKKCKGKLFSYLNFLRLFLL